MPVLPLLALLTCIAAVAAEDVPTFYVQAKSGLVGTPHSYRQIGLFADKIDCADLIYGEPAPGQTEVPRAIADRIVVELTGQSLAEYRKELEALTAAVPDLAGRQPAGSSVSLYYQGKSYEIGIDENGVKDKALEAINARFIPAKFRMVR